jgi:hypothetical protein
MALLGGPIDTNRFHPVDVSNTFNLNLSAAWALNTRVTYNNTIRRYFDFCEEHILASLAAIPAHMA